MTRATPVLGTLLCLGALPLAAQQRAPRRAAVPVEQLPESLVQRWVDPRLDSNQSRQDPIFIGRLGPSPRTILVLAASGNLFSGFALADTTRATPKLALPELSDSAIFNSVEAVLFEPAPGDSAPYIIVIATYITGIGQGGGTPFYHNAVLQWNGTRFVRLPAIEQRIAELQTAGAVRRVLRAAVRK